MALVRIQCPRCGHVGVTQRGALPGMLRCLGCGGVERINGPMAMPQELAAQEHRLRRIRAAQDADTTVDALMGYSVPAGRSGSASLAD